MYQSSPLALYVHLVWGTWERRPLLVKPLETAVHRALVAQCLTLKGEAVAIGGVADHVHLLVRMPATLSVAELVKRLKGTSTHLVTHQLAPDHFFRWQVGYGAVTVSPRHIAQVSTYIARQHEHHAANTAHAALELPHR